MTPFEIALLRASASDRSLVRIEVASCAYACCSRGWQRRDYEATYQGWVDNLNELDGGAFMLYSPGIGTISYTVAVRFEEVLEVGRVG